MSEVTDRTPAFELATILAEPEFFTVDGEEYRLLGLDHISTEEEARVIGLFGRYNWLTKQYEAVTEDKEGAKIGALLIAQRIKILTAMTDMPTDVAKRLPPTAQLKLVEYMSDMVPGSAEA
jgi:hypothetical protein